MCTLGISVVVSMIVVGTYCQCFYTGTCYTAHDAGVSYRGHVSITRNGSRCIDWVHHLHTFTPDRFRYDGLDSNFCRNPLGKRPAPWCYTSPSGDEESSWDVCSVPMCDKCLFRGLQMKLGDRFHDGCSLCVCQDVGINCLECPGPVFTREMGCYVKYNNAHTFPRCCPKVVCHGEDGDFVMDEYFAYLTRVLRAHQQAHSTSSLATSSHSNSHVQLSATMSNTSQRVSVLP